MQSQFTGRHKVELVRSGLLAQLFAHFVGISRTVDELHLHVLCGILERDIAVGIGIETIHLHTAVGCHILADIAPNVGNERLDLHTVGLTHLRENERFHIAFIGTYTEHLHLYAYLLQQILIEDGLRGYAVPVEHTAGIDQHLIGNAGHIVSALRIVVAISHNELAGLLEILECPAYLLERGKVGTGQTALYIDAGYVFVSGGYFNSFQNVFEPLFLGNRTSEKGAERILHDALGDGAVQIQMQHTALADVSLAVRRGNHGGNHDKPHDKGECSHDDKAYDDSAYLF